MKGNYFTNETINEKSLEMLRKLKEMVKIHRINLIPEQSALLILDMQRCFLDERSHAFVPSALPIIPRIRNLANAFHNRNRPIIITRHLNTEEDAGLMAQWWKDVIIPEDEFSEIITELHIPESIVIRKTQYDGFYRTPLEEILREKGISQLIITGVMSHLCCETTARSAFVRGFVVFFPIDGTATYNEDFHRATLLSLSHGFVIPALMEELQTYVESLKSG